MSGPGPTRALGLAMLLALAGPAASAPAPAQEQAAVRQCPKWPQKEDVGCYEQRQALLRMVGRLAPAGLAFMALVLIVSMRGKREDGLAALYPRVDPAAGTSRTRTRVVFGKGPAMTWVKLGVDHRHLHVSVLGALGAGAAFSVPLEEVTAEPDRFPMMILAPDVIRLTFARDRTRPMLVWPHVFARLSAAGVRCGL